MLSAVPGAPNRQLQTSLLIGGCVLFLLLPLAVVIVLVMRSLHPAPPRPVHHAGFKLAVRQLPAGALWSFALRLPDRPGLQVITPWTDPPAAQRHLLTFEPSGDDPLHQTQDYPLTQPDTPFVVGTDGRMLYLDDGPYGDNPAAAHPLKFYWTSPHGTRDADRPGYTYLLSRADHQVGILLLDKDELAFCESLPLPDGSVHVWLETPGNPPQDIQSVPDVVRAGTAWFAGAQSFVVLTRQNRLYVFDRKTKRMRERPELGSMAALADATGDIDVLSLSDSLLAVLNSGGQQLHVYSASGASLELKLQDPLVDGPNGRPRLLPLQLLHPVSGDTASQYDQEGQVLRDEGPLVPADVVGCGDLATSQHHWNVRVMPAGPDQLAVVDYYYNRIVLISPDPAP